ncbi:MAG: hypothetical protein ABI549_09585 [Flavobacterium sp.]|uniref:hypothetical protein n=1 Tax=Flavobacterium sp. TaxID=239 RepID=UPI003264E9C6
MKNCTNILLIICLCFFSCKNEIEANSSVKTTSDNNQEELTSNSFEKEKNTSEPEATQMDRDQRIIGTWRHTEVISSGSGDAYLSMTTDDFVQFKENGVVDTWTGDAVAGGFESKSDGNVQEGLWNTNALHTQVIFKDRDTKQEVSVNYFVENVYLMFSNGNSKKVYERIN